MADEQNEHPGRDGLPGKREHNREEKEPVEPTKRRTGEHEDGDETSDGNAGEGSQSTGNPDSAG